MVKVKGEGEGRKVRKITRARSSYYILFRDEGQAIQREGRGA